MAVQTQVVTVLHQAQEITVTMVLRQGQEIAVVTKPAAPILNECLTIK